MGHGDPDGFTFTPGLFRYSKRSEYQDSPPGVIADRIRPHQLHPGLA
jgi:hypothetical protein